MAPLIMDSNRRPLRSIPSPTLTNFDMLLPDEAPSFPLLSSPPRPARRDRPPSPGYLRHQPKISSPSDPRHQTNYTSSRDDAAMFAAGKREKRGLMSRKMMLLRSRTASNGYGVRGGQEATHSLDSAFTETGDLGPEQYPGSKWSTDESEAESEDMSGLPQFLAKYKSSARASRADDDLEGSTTVGLHEYPESTVAPVSDEDEEERLQKEKDEQASAILSKRAEQILANAKKRLNLMEGNLRGARDLVAPLTAANLKRATSVASYVPPINNFGGITRYVEGGYQYDPTTRKTYRRLHAQASNPVLGRDYQGHARGFSEADIPERISPKFPATQSFAYVTPQRALKGSRSHDSLGKARFLDTRTSPDSGLAPLIEDDAPISPVETPRSRAETRDGTNNRSSLTPEHLHEQMSSLRGRISALKERAREDSLKRKSTQNMREVSPLNNASGDAPELFCASSPTYISPSSDSRAGLGSSNQRNRDVLQPATRITTGSRNAFAEQAKHLRKPSRESDKSTASTLRGNDNTLPPSTHRRTPSGTAVVQSSKHRYSHHQSQQAQDAQGTYEHGSDIDEEEDIGTAHEGTSHYGDDEKSAVGGSVYEDATPLVVAHEDREDAFDYENFFLHSAMSYYASDLRPASKYSEDSVDSGETERGPTATADILDSYRDSYAFSNSGSELEMPQTPEQLRETERNLHRRTISEDSASSFHSAIEGQESSDTDEMSSARVSTAMEWPMPPSDPNTSRPGTAVPIKPRQIEIARSDSSSDRADSGLGSNGSQDNLGRSQMKTPMHKSSLSSSAAMSSPMLGPPLSPGAVSRDPATLAVNALLTPDGRLLGLRDKALVFSMVESLKTVCRQLQKGEETSLESRALRRRLDDARRVLLGGTEVRPGTS